MECKKIVEGSRDTPLLGQMLSFSFICSLPPSGKSWHFLKMEIVKYPLLVVHMYKVYSINQYNGEVYVQKEMTASTGQLIALHDINAIGGSRGVMDVPPCLNSFDVMHFWENLVCWRPS